MMSKVIVLVFSVVGLFNVSVGQVIQDGQCDENVPLQPDFDIQRFLGTWEEYVRTDNPIQQGECSAFRFTDSNGLEMVYSAVNNNFLEETTGTMTQEGNSAAFIISIPSIEVPIAFSVLETLPNVYETFAITFSCRNLVNNKKSIYIWVIKRPNANMNDMTDRFINTRLTDTFGIEFATLRRIDHEERTCFVLPVIEPGEPIIFPGQCPTTLPVVQDFNVDRFTGLWHQISSYESPNGNGGCARAEISRTDNGVLKILNSQVVDQQVVTIDGIAELTGTEAKLTVVLNIPGAEYTARDLWILRSDYDNYAVAYSCVNEGDSNRRVYSWILSRSRRLSPSVQADVDEAIRSYLDLNSMYYKPTDQSDEACFYYPEPSDEPVVFRGQCESVNVKPMENFEADRYMGIWHNIEMYPSRYQDGTCSNAFYDLVDGQLVIVVNSQVKNERLETVKGVGVPASDGSAKLVVTFPNPGSDEPISTEYWILDTDYNNYALVYTCRNLNENDMQVNTWKLSKTKQLLSEYEQAINDFISPIPYLNNNYYKKEDQSERGCFYFPEPQDNVPVVFPGQCEESVALVESFDFTQFSGTWYEIESYPKTERTGQCVNHQFSSIDSARLNLVSSSVTDQFRGELNGVVSRSSATDNSGRLTITIIDANGQVKNTPFWVLSTVYDDYAFAYGCENIGHDFRAVWSWKLSRNRELSTAATTAIRNAMASNIVLRDEYFDKIDHSNDACFYLPELVPGEPVILLGQCDRSIVGVPDFDIEKYAGRWRLIKSYGADFQQGTCNVARYTLQASNALAVTNSQVVNAELASISGTATVTSTDGSGRLTFNLGGESFEVIILATDYDSYSLGYGCVDLPDNQRRVYSWKMSRENTLSQDAINSIDQVIDRIQVLNNRFYYDINRTDTGCFYFPAHDPNVSVKFRGQCDQNIPVVTDFKPEQYLGTWYDIESYPGDFQNGKCNTAIYSQHPEAGIDVDVYNTQVINEVLFSIRGTAVQDPSTDGSAKLTVTFNVGGIIATSNYWVVATDYDSYALVYSCQPVDDEYVQVTGWKLSRTRQLEADAKTKINEAMGEIRALDQRYFIERDQSREACFYYPEPQPGVPVVFPGRCDENIYAVPDFDMNLFQGTWHEIAAYPKANQEGQCISQQFAVNATNSMRLDSLSVLDLTQSATEGHVTFASDDDLSGKLDINIWVNGEAQSIPYWILSTDYNNYALAYSCVNIDKDTRGVWSWKLSKTRELSDESNAAINAAIAKVDVLRNDYYENIQQTDTACFHLPDITPGDNVVLPGQCDLSIAGMTDFDISRYAGEWRLIENYGSRYQSGTCNVARYTQQASNILAITNSQVVNGQLGSISGTATVTSTDGSGRLTFSMRNREYTMYILETDYDSFALAYGCVNSGADQRRVTSWKFSRYNTLSPDATNRINEIISGIEVLHQPYYYHVDRSPYACFYFPEPDRHTPVRFRGQCDHQSVTVVPEFDVEKYMGVWYDIESYPIVFQNGECPNARYAALDSNTVSVYNTHVVDQSLSAINGLATVASTDGSAKLKVTFDGQNPDAASDYWVLSTDYDSYALVYSCTNDGEDYMNVASWKLSRTRQLESDAKSKIDEVMRDIRALDQRYFIERDQSREACFYYPEPQPGVPVVFPGQCDESIEAVPDFDMNLFQGTWHEIAAYPKANQEGQCISQQFAVNATNRMRLDSLSVLDLTQSATEGHVTFASDDDLSGKLDINIWVNGEAQSIPYWILSTDYNNYALAYSCVNIDKDTRGVWSWKLSKTRELSDESNAAINAAIAKVDVLRNDYYENIQQTDTACFHLPDITPGDNVVLPGQCDLSIAGMADFDISRYAGEWRLIENYGSRYQSGTCNVARYTQQASNILAITNSQVVNGQLASISGTATVTSTDGSGRLTFSMRNREYTMYILETDYDSFALAYGCVNSGADQRRVTSWKFSRYNTLSPDATNRINEIISGIEVLHQPYYYHVDRSPYACFYFPEPDRHTPVRFRGQCDHQSVTVVPEFDVEKYMGVWYDIESYPVVFQNGECPNARYAALDSNTVSVYNTHVVDQSLSAINGLATVASTDGSAKLKVTFDGQNPDAASDYWVLSTDYDSYALVYSCTNDGEDYMNVASWKLSRTRQLESDAKSKIDEVMRDIRALDQRYFIERDQSREACFYYPEPQPGVPVVFPGQCDESIEAVPDFDMNLFQGTWHEIAAYPKANQEGQCISQQFAVNATNRMRLDSLSVLDLTQSATEGHVTFASDDDLSGKLDINIWVNGEAQSIPYWILSTDYHTYALAYSCVNIDKDTRGVWSWKLSKTRELSDESNAAINAAIAKVDVLRNDYYENIQQTDTACFHLPDITPGDNVVLPGQCDLSIAGMADFDISRYAGEWRLIENYGSRYQSGTCNVARYTQQASNILAITNSQVVNGQLGSISGTATVTSTDGSGRLTFSMRNREYTMYILETDYDSFALAYGCVNSGADQRRVTSWKFSRYNTLSPDATNRINEIISGIEVLHQPYYYHVDRSPYACFYFPEPDRHTPVRFRGQCDHQSVTVVPEFDVEKYMGVWYDIESYPVVFQNGECPNARYAALDSNTVSVYNTHVVDQSLSAINGLATVASTDGSAKLKVTFDGQNLDAASDYWVLSTDYDSYALVYSCTNDGEDYMNVASWKLSRTRQLESDAKSKIDEVMRDIRALDQRYFIERDQSREACFYYPEPQPGVPVVFPGQCDESIEAVPDFDMNLFQGTWREIAAYPKANQEGQCISQQFAVNATNSMRLDSLSVLDLTQSATEGHVTFASDDDLSGKLDINIWVNGEAQSIPYWILSTDYNNYALAYSCVNIDKDTRGVWSWKLSKTRELSDESNAAISAAIAKVDVLSNDYYENIQQTDSACFHYPELGPTDPVVFPGRCNYNIPVVQNFDASRYQGRWRLLESYYSDFQEGACNAANYSVADDGSVIVVNSKVVNEELISVTGTAVPDASGNGKFIVTFPNSAPAEYWILATDYESYALIYSCVDLPDDQRRVWSWKMSKRSNNFSVGANNVINQIINNVDVLHARYYQPIDRTEVGCFYYPPPPTPESMFYSLKFPGQCDESIAVQQNFNAELYSGEWFDVESYPSNFQSGTCNTAKYTSNPDGTLTVQNTQVVDQLLQTVTGSAVPTTTDRSAKFDVTLSSGSGTAIKYWVLATDYRTYSLVYSCRNLDDEFREVYSWKLGRQPAIPELAETVINDVIEKVQVLDKEYFISRTHTDAACFYYPDMDDGHVILDGQCLPDADVPAVPNFNPNQFSGVWYEISRYPSELQNGECTATEYALNSAGIFDVIQTSVIEEEELRTDTQASVASNGRGVISINVNGVPFNNVYILATVYTDYAVAYSCRDVDANRKQLYSWKLSRSRTGLSESATNAINDLISTNIDLHEPYYRKTGQDHSSCFYYPEFVEPPQYIELPGPCDESVTGVSGFNMHNFLGTWYEVARYPQPAQTGQCNRAVYGPGDTASVFNFVHRQVIDEALGEISGVAAVTNEDGQIEVTFNVGGETRTAKYYVLTTDYNSYALLYSCVNIDNGERRRVGSWKLSKTTELSWQANVDMDDVITDTQGLRQQYYQDTSQTDAACFYYPEFVEPPQYIELPGPCDQSITGVTDFNVQNFLGEWFEVARYPEPAQTGQCNLAKFVAGSASGSFSIETSQVVNVSLSEIGGVATVTSSDGSGRLTVTYDGGAGPYEYYVLATDYTGFALVYTCINTPNLNRRVFSWKLSRNTELSEAANNTIKEIIDNTQGLKQEYYQHTSHSHEACFHYPTQTGDRVVLPGQCDDNISAVESFNVARFANNSWYQIRRYDAVGDSSCAGTRLSFDDETGNIEVLNFEVVDEDLLTTDGSGRLNSSDGSGIFSLVLNDSEDDDDENTKTDLYILATDYDGYALAYSCKNINSNQREVGAWQLSRGRTLTEASNAVITEIISERPELHEPYFKLISQPEGCLEPSSAFFFKSSIILIFVCTVLHLIW